jgi:hypothetical protein
MVNTLAVTNIHAIEVAIEISEARSQFIGANV